MARRLNSNGWTLAKVCFVLVSICIGKSPVHGSNQPNIILIMSDDMGFSDIGCYGGEIATPNLDALAAGGVRFTQFYNGARCCPTRASLLTGLHPHQAGVGHMMSDRGYEGYRGDLNQRCRTIPEVLATAGYRSYMSGKWHVAQSIKPDGPKHNWPMQRGFSRFYGMISGAGSFYDPKSLVRDNASISPVNDSEYQPDEYYFTDAISDHAVRYIEDHTRSHQDEPFFLYVAYTAAHWPMQALERDIAKYKGRYDEGFDAIRKSRLAKMKSLGLVSPECSLSKAARDWNDVELKDWERRCMEVYAAMVDNMDQGIGRIVSKLKSSDILDNTLIVFLQDNGGCAERFGRGKPNAAASGEGLAKLPPLPDDFHQLDMVPRQTRDGRPYKTGDGVMPGPDGTYIAYGLGWANVSNTPFREYKHWVHEGGISTPLIAHWPDRIKSKGELVREQGQLVDLMATFVDVSRADYEAATKTAREPAKVHSLQGVSLLPAMQGESLKERPLFWEHEGNRAVRLGDWKLVAKGQHSDWELYDMATDRVEQNDLSKEHPDHVKRMADLWQSWAERSYVLPLNPERPMAYSKKKKFKLGPTDKLSREKAPFVANRGFRIEVNVSKVDDGVLIAQGGSSLGYALHIHNGKLRFASRVGGKLESVQSSKDVATGAKKLSAEILSTGELRMMVDGQTVATGKLARTLKSMPIDGLEVGQDLGGLVGRYRKENAFQGKIESAMIQLLE